jgi:hypothetical protein
MPMVFGVWPATMAVRPDMNDRISPLRRALHHHVVAGDGPDLNPVTRAVEMIFTEHKNIGAAWLRCVVVLQEHRYTVIAVFPHLVSLLLNRLVNKIMLE